jgi:hypothetical protein
MRPRTALGVGVVLVAIVGAVVVLRDNQSPGGQSSGEQTSTAVQNSTVDARARQLTAAFGRTTLLPATVRFAADPNNPPGFVFHRYDTDSAPGIRPVRYTAQGSLVRRVDGAVLAQVQVVVQQAGPTAGFGACDTIAVVDGPSCSDQVFPDGTQARVVRNPQFVRFVGSSAAAKQPPALQTELDVASPTGTTMSVTLFAIHGATVPLDDTAMLRLAMIPGVSAQ